MAFQLPNLPYASNALEPHIDARTMEIHHGKHHQAYVTNLNNAIAGTDAENMSIEDICKNISGDSYQLRWFERKAACHIFKQQVYHDSDNDNDQRSWNYF